MPDVMINEEFQDVLDHRQRVIRDGLFKRERDRVSDHFGTDIKKEQFTERFSSLIGLPPMELWSGRVHYDSLTQGYNVTAIDQRFSMGLRIERDLLHYDKKNLSKLTNLSKYIMRSSHQNRQIYAARPYHQAFSVDTLFYTRSEGVAMCGTHTTNRTDVVGTTGLVNVATAGISKTALESMLVTFWNFHDDVGQPLSDSMPLKIMVPSTSVALRAQEIIKTPFGFGTPARDKNVLADFVTIEKWNRLNAASGGSDTNYFLVDTEMEKENQKWMDVYGGPGQKDEFARLEDIDLMQARLRKVDQFSQALLDWRHILGANVS